MNDTCIRFEFTKEHETHRFLINSMVNTELEPNRPIEVYQMDSFFLILTRLTPSLASMSFTDLSNREIKIPNGLIVYECDFETGKLTNFSRLFNSEKFILCWTDNYVVKYKRNTVLNIECRKSWDLCYIPRP